MSAPKKKEQKSGIPQDMSFRSAHIKLDTRGVPESLDKENRSVEIICSTEAPVTEFCYTRWENIPTILLMSGAQIPENGQVVLLDTHMRWDTSTVLGSCRDMRVEDDLMLARAHYSGVEKAQAPWQLTEEGHLTDYSVGRCDIEAHYIPEGEKQTIEGREFEGPVKVVTKWIPKEMSVCPIGADEFAKARADRPQPEPKHMKEKVMDAKLRKFLETRGLSKDATEEEAWRHLETLNVRKEEIPEGQTPAALAKRASIEGAQAEQTRIIEVRSIGATAELSDEAIMKHVTDGDSADVVRKAALDHIVAKRNEGDLPGHRQIVTPGADEVDKFRAAASDSLIVRGGMQLEQGREFAPGHDELTGLTLRELCREALRVAGKQSGGSARDMIGRALTTSDLPFILGDASNRALMTGFDAAEETYPIWCDDTGSVSDFRNYEVGRASETQDLEEVKEEGEFKYGKLSDKKETFKLATYGKILPVSRQALINDDLNALIDIPMKHGESWKRKIGDVAYAVLTANANMGDGVALFHATHANLGAAGAISETTIAEAIKKMKLQKDIAGLRRLNIMPLFLMAPVALEGAAEVFFGSNNFAAADSATTRQNIYAGRFTRVYEPRLDDDSSTAWYMAGAARKTVRLSYLDGQKAPFLEMRQGWTIDGTEFKVRGDVVAKALDWVALFKNAGS